MNETWDAPGPGTWEADRAHFDRTISRLTTDVIEAGAPRGMREGFDLIGAPLETMDIRFVNGQMYRRLVPIIGGSGKGPSKPPPAWLARAVFAVHPRLRRRARTAEQALNGKGWQQEAQRWEASWKPELTATNRRLARVDVSGLADDALADHLDGCIAHLIQTTVLHFRLHISDLGPVAVLLDHADGWDLDPVDVMDVLAGASPSTSAPRDALRPLARELADRGVEPKSLEDVRRASDRAAALLDEYLVEFGTRLTGGYDIGDLTLAEMPQLIVSSLRDPGLLADRTAAEAAAARGAAAWEQLRGRVPEGDRQEFDELVADARRLYGLRDENGPITFEWPGGVLRIAVVEAGRRLRAAGRLHAEEHVFDLSRAELVGALRGEPGPHANAVRTRHERRLACASTDSPEFLGPEPIEPDLDALPDAMRTMMRMSLNAISLLEAVEAHGALRGTGIGETPYRGTARVVADADDAFARCEPGDVIITRFTAPTFNAVLATAGAVVTEQGGLLCHTAVIARELGIAGVVGAAGVLDLPDGAEVEVDPVAGTVTVV